MKWAIDLREWGETASVFSYCLSALHGRVLFRAGRGPDNDSITVAVYNNVPMPAWSPEVESCHRCGGLVKAGVQDFYYNFPDRDPRRSLSSALEAHLMEVGTDPLTAGLLSSAFSEALASFSGQPDWTLPVRTLPVGARITESGCRERLESVEEKYGL